MLKKIGLITVGCCIFVLGAIVVEDFDSYAKVVHAEKLKQTGIEVPLDEPLRLVFSVRDHTFATTTVLPGYRVNGQWNQSENSEALFESSGLVSSMDEGQFEIEGTIEFLEGRDTYLIRCQGHVSTERIENSSHETQANVPQSQVVASMDTFVIEFDASTLIVPGQEVDLVRKDNDVLRFKLGRID